MIEGSSCPADEAVRLFLADCARPRVADAFVEQLRRRAAAIRDWDACVSRAEQQGLGPLLHAHMRAGVIAPPDGARRQLWALYIRHREQNRIRLQVLGELLGRFAAAGIPAAVLKGPVLASLVYGDPGLRPMGDLDLLVPMERLVEAQRELGRMGFNVSVPASAHRLRRKHHLSPATRIVDGLAVVVEVHGDAFGADRGATLRWEARGEPPLTFAAGGVTAESLGLPQMLWHLCRHMTGLWHPLRLIWVSDVIGFAATYASELDWPRMASEMPFVPSTLAMIDQLTALPDAVRSRAGIATKGAAAGVGLDYAGWPRTPPRTGEQPTRRAYVAETLLPREWWLRLNYGAADGSLMWAHVHHARALGRLAVRRVRDRLQ